MRFGLALAGVLVAVAVVAVLVVVFVLGPVSGPRLKEGGGPRIPTPTALSTRL